ncbi:MAG: ornithine cyclodeaminase family protein [Oscillospiraceae bacterium]|nr:ornithine cyclodeaminase family protein [Oscillospiraceae bacterium]
MSAIPFRYLSQEDLIRCGAFDLPMAIKAAQDSIRLYDDGRILFPEKIVQEFDEVYKDRINCLPATLLDKQICGMKWVSVFPRNPQRFGTQNLSAIIVLSHIEKGYPVCVMDGTLCSNMRVAAIGATAAQYLAREDAESIGFIGAGEQARMHLLGMKAVRPGLKVCRVAAKYAHEEEGFIRALQPIFPDMEFIACGTVLEDAIRESDIIVTATSAQAPLLKPEWVKKGAFYSHIGGWECDYGVITMADKLVCDDWSVVRHRLSTITRVYNEGLITDNDITGDLIDLLKGKVKRDNDDEFIVFSAAGLSYVDIAIAEKMFRRAEAADAGSLLNLQEQTVFEHELSGLVRV